MTSKLQTTRWAFDLSTWSPTLTQLGQAVAAVQPEERERLIKFHFINDFLSSLMGRLLMRKYVSDCSGLDYHEVKLARDARGKPYWVTASKDDKTQSQLSFNVSHQGSYVILAGVHNVCHDTTTIDVGIGCDVMKLEYAGGKDLQEFFRLMHRKFADTEWRYIAQSSFNRQDQLKAFMRHWCLKEAYVKELGVGITIDLEKIAFTVDTSNDLTAETSPLRGTRLQCNGVPMHNWHFEEHMLHPKYCAAIACRNYKPEKVEKFTFLKIDELLKPSSQAENAEIMEYCRNAMRKQSK